MRGVCRMRSWSHILLLTAVGVYWVTSIHWMLHQHHQQPQQTIVGDEPAIYAPSRISPDTIPITEKSAVTSDGLSSYRRNETNEVWDQSPAQPGAQGVTPRQRRPLDPLWWKPYIHELARPWNHRSIRSWCRQDFHMFPPAPPFLLGHHKMAKGMIYIKLYKASSSTCEGVARSIAHHVGTRYWQHQQEQLRQRQRERGSSSRTNTTHRTPFKINKALLYAITYHKTHHNSNNNTITHSNHHTHAPTVMCRAWTRHEFADARMHARRDLNHSLLWTFVRNPAARDLSHIFHFEIGRNGWTNMTSKQIQDLIQMHQKGRQTRYLVTRIAEPTPLWPLHALRKNRTKVIQILNREIFQNYDFIGLTERMNESLACMVLLWNLRPQDVIVLNAKRSGGYDDGGGGNACTKIPKVPSPLDPFLRDYLTNRHPIMNADMLLYHAAIASLEMTMDALGRDKVLRMSQYIERLQQIAQRECEHEAYFPCSPEGVFQPTLAKQSCYVQDSGCGYECIHRVLANITMKTLL
jgi:hypothetical protein